MDIRAKVKGCTLPPRPKRSGDVGEACIAPRSPSKAAVPPLPLGETSAQKDRNNAMTMTKSDSRRGAPSLTPSRLVPLFWFSRHSTRAASPTPLHFFETDFRQLRHFRQDSDAFMTSDHQRARGSMAPTVSFQDGLHVLRLDPTHMSVCAYNVCLSCRGALLLLIGPPSTFLHDEVVMFNFFGGYACARTVASKPLLVRRRSSPWRTGFPPRSGAWIGLQPPREAIFLGAVKKGAAPV